MSFFSSRPILDKVTEESVKETSSHAGSTVSPARMVWMESHVRAAILYVRWGRQRVRDGHGTSITLGRMVAANGLMILATHINSKYVHAMENEKTLSFLLAIFEKQPPAVPG